jgi:hypothetical protein
MLRIICTVQQYVEVRSTELLKFIALTSSPLSLQPKQPAISSACARDVTPGSGTIPLALT